MRCCELNRNTAETSEAFTAPITPLHMLATSSNKATSKPQQQQWCWAVVQRVGATQHAQEAPGLRILGLHSSDMGHSKLPSSISRIWRSTQPAPLLAVLDMHFHVLAVPPNHCLQI
jgi:hypothetical protein